MKRGVLVLVVVALTCLVWASVAAAQGPATGGYGGAGGNVQGDVGGEVGGAGPLPFTGLDLVFVIGAGLLLVAAGLTIRRLSRAKG